MRRLLFVFLALTSCSSGELGDVPLIEDSSTSDTTIATDDTAGDTGTFAIDTAMADDTGTTMPDGCVGDACPPEAFCGDGKLTVGEACDDGNAVAGDGCTADCKSIETNWACPKPGEACTFLVKCGDG